MASRLAAPEGSKSLYRNILPQFQTEHKEKAEHTYTNIPIAKLFGSRNIENRTVLPLFRPENQLRFHKHYIIISVLPERKDAAIWKIAE